MSKSILRLIGLLLLLALPYHSGAHALNRERLRQVYTSQVGISERTNRNDGAGPKKYLAYCGLKEGNEWCGSFVSWCYYEAGIPVHKSAWAAAWFSRSKAVYMQGWTHFQRMPQPGDVVLYYIHYKHRIGHVGFWDSFDGQYSITVEGNTEVNHWGGVHRLRRYTRSIYAIVNWID